MMCMIVFDIVTKVRIIDKKLNIVQWFKEFVALYIFMKYFNPYKLFHKTK